MEYRKEDRRVIRTKNDLKKSFFSLLEEKHDIKKVSIVDITEKANYNRATFYMHYPDKQSLINEIIDEALEGFLDAFREPYKKVTTLDLDKLSMHSIRVFKYIEDNSDTFRLLFNNKAFIGFHEKFSNAIEEVILNELFNYEDQYFEGINKELFVRSHSYSIIGIISFWIEHDFIYSSDFMNEQLLMIARYDSTKIKIINSKN